METNRPPKKKNKIARKLVLLIVLFSSLITVITTGIQLFRDYRHDLNQIDSHLNMFRTVYLQGLTNSVWQFDETQLKIQMEGLLRLQDIEYIEITPEGSGPWSAGEKKSKNIVGISVPMVQIYQNREYPIATLYVQAGLDGVYNRLLDKFLVILLGNAVKTFLVSGFILLLFQILVARHLAKIAEYLKNLNINSPNIPLELDRKSSPEGEFDELEQLTSAINQMRSAISGHIREREKKEREIQESEAKYRFLINTVNEAIFIIQESKIRFPNQKAVEISGYPETELEGSLFENLIAPEDVKQVRTWHDLMLTGQAQSNIISFRVVKKNGEQFWGQLNSASTVWQEKPASINFLRDITEQKKTEEELLESYSILQVIFDGLDQDVYVSDISTNKIIFLNKHMSESFGGAPIGRPCHLVFRGHESKCPGCPVDKIIRPDGRPAPPVTQEGYNPVTGKWYRNHDRAITWIDDSLVHLHFAVDITEQKQAGREKAKLSSLVENSSDFVGLADLDGTIVYINQAGSAMVNDNNRSSADPANLVDFFEPDAAKQLENSIIPQIFENGLWKGESLLRSPNGRPVPVDVNLFLVNDPETGEPSCLAAVIRDISERVDSLKEREKLEEQLRQSQKMEAIGRLAGGIAHDFNNILAAIIGYNELTLLDLPENSPQAGQIRESIEAGRRAKNLIQQILTFSRKIPHQKQVIDVTAIVEEALRFLRATLPSTIEIYKDIPRQSSPVEADATQIHQVIMNLCTNSSQAMGEQGGMLRVFLSQVNLKGDEREFSSAVKPGRYVKLSIADEGPGIDPELQDRIFEPFFSTKESGKGSGMGLAVVHGIVKSHGGEITFKSRLGQGTVFNVFLPAMDSVPASAPLEAAESLLTGRERILFVDDERALVDIGRQLLERLGYDVRAVVGGPAGLKAFLDDPSGYDLIITDQTMPGLTGLDLSREILRRRPDIPIIICTGYSNSISSETVVNTGARAVLMKPLALRELSRVVREALA